MEDAGYGGSGSSAKRRRDEVEEAPDAKKIRVADLILLDILEDAADPADGDLASVMRSFEEEIAPFSPPPSGHQRVEDGGVSTSAEDKRGSDFGYLLEASDDELGLPPAVPSPSEGDGAEGALGEVGNQEAHGLGQIWGLEDEMPSGYDALEFGLFGQDGSVATSVDHGLVFDGGLFDYADAAALGEFAEFSWQPESLPAV